MFRKYNTILFKDYLLTVYIIQYIAISAFPYLLQLQYSTQSSPALTIHLAVGKIWKLSELYTSAQQNIPYRHMDHSTPQVL